MSRDETPPAIDGDASSHPLIDTHRSVDDENPRPVPVDVDTDEIPPPRDPPGPRQYIEIRPAEQSVRMTDVARAMDTLYATLERATKTGLRHRLTRSTQRPLVEWLIVADGQPDTSVRYLVGTSHEPLQEDLEGILRTCFPCTYELREVEFHPRFVEDYLPVQPADTSETGDAQAAPVDPEYLSQPYVAGVEYEGRAGLPRDWLTPLTPVADANRRSRASTGRRGRSERSTTGHGSGSEDSPRVPLAGLLESITSAEVPVVYQVVCEYHGSVRDAADEYVWDLEDGAPTFVSRCLREIFPEDPEASDETEPPRADQNRIDGIEDRDCNRTFVVSARAVALTRHEPRRADRVADHLASGLGPLGDGTHKIAGRVHTDNSDGLLAGYFRASPIRNSMINPSLFPSFTRI